MKMIHGIHHAALRVKHLEEAFTRWSHVLGLHGETRDGEGFLRCTFEDFALRLIPASGVAGLEYVAYELAAGVKLEVVRGELEAKGVVVRGVQIPGRGEALRLNDPDGNGVVLLERQLPSETRVAEWRFSGAMPAFHPRKFGHVNYLTSDVQRITAWYEDTLGFRLTDRIGSEGTWLHVNADHHVLAFLEKGFNHVHHLAFELVDWGEFRVALDHLGKNRRHIVWGPGRHGMARNLYSYFRMPEEDLFVELYADLEQLKDDHVPRDYPDDAHASNVWGILPPRSYFRFDAEAIRSENDQLEAYQGTVPT
jgi:catechol 2,3-dioxygenase-like lactoylglutathione lyase family enzyme